VSRLLTRATYLSIKFKRYLAQACADDDDDDDDDGMMIVTIIYCDGDEVDCV